MHHDVRAESERLRQDGRRNGRIHNDCGTGGARDLADERDIGDGPQRIGGRFDPHQPGRAGADGAANFVGRAHVEQLDLESPMRGESRQPVAQRPVHHPGCEHVVAWRQRLEHCRCRGHAGREQQRGTPAFERRQDRLGLIERRALIARIDASGAVLVVGVADEGRRRVNRRRDRARLVVHPAERLRGDAGGFESSRVHPRRLTCARRIVAASRDTGPACHRGIAACARPAVQVMRRCCTAVSSTVR